MTTKQQTFATYAEAETWARAAIEMIHQLSGEPIHEIKVNCATHAPFPGAVVLRVTSYYLKPHMQRHFAPDVRESVYLGFGLDETGQFQLLAINAWFTR